MKNIYQNLIYTAIQECRTSIVQRKYGMFAFFAFILLYSTSSFAQSLTGVQLAGGITADRYPVSVGVRTLMQNNEKNITFKIKNTSGTAISRAFKLYMMPTPSGTPILLWEGVASFVANETKIFDRTTNTELGAIVTQNLGTYRLELRGSNTPNTSTVKPTSPLVSPVTGVNPLSIKVIADAVTLTLVTETIGTSAVKYPTSIGNLIIQTQKEKNISFTLRNLSSGAISRAFKLFITPQPSGPTTEVWSGVVNFTANQSLTFNRNNVPALGSIVTETPGQYKLELRGSNIPDVNTVTVSAPLVPVTSNASNPVIVTVVECPDDYLVISPASPISVCDNGTVTLSVPFSPNFTYQWRLNGNNLIGATTNTYVAGVSGSYDLVTSKVNCPSFISPAVTVTVYAPIVATISGLAAQYSNQDPPVTLTGNPSGGMFTGPGISGNSFNPNTAGPGTHTIIYSGNYLGCDYSATITVTVIDCPASVDITPNGNVYTCNGGIQNFSTPLVPGYTYQWRRDGVNISGATSSNYGTNISGVYDVVISKLGCSPVISNTANLTVTPVITATITGLAAQYSNQATPVTLTGSPAGGTFSGPGISGNTFDPNLAGVGTHNITYSGTLNTCPYTITRSVIVIDCPVTAVVSPAGPISVCYNTNIGMTTPLVSGATYQWKKNGIDIPGETNRDITVINNSGNFSVVVSKTGCMPVTSNVVSVTFAPQIMATISGLNNTYSNLDPPVTMIGSPAGGTFSGPGVSGNQFRPNIAGPGTHTITYQGFFNSCPYTISRNVTVVLCPNTISISPNGNITICDGGSLLLTAPNDPTFSYQWRLNNTNISGAIFRNYTATASGTYDVVVTKIGCSPITSNTAIITVQPPIVVTITAPDTVLTTDPPFNLIGTPPGGNFSGPGVIANTFFPAIAGVGRHTIMYSGIFNGCPYTGTTQIVVMPDGCSDIKYWGERRSVAGANFWGVIDFDDDGMNDVVTSNANPGYLKFYRNNGGGLDAPITLTTPLFPKIRLPYSGVSDGEDIFFTDFDNDGNKDLLITFYDGFCNNNAVRIYWGLGAAPYFNAGTFFDFALGGASCIDGYGIDYDGDGLKDVFIEAAFGAERMYHNMGGRVFTTVPTVSTGRDVGFSVDDWNLDGRNDLLGIDMGAFDGIWGVRYHSGLGNGNFSPSLNYYATPSTEHPTLPHLKMQADLNQNFDLDFVFNARNDGTNAKRLYTGTWDGSTNNFIFNTQDVLPDRAQLRNIIDYDGDGNQDIIVFVQNFMGTNVLFAQLGDGNGNFNRRQTIISSPNYVFFGIFDLQTECLKALGANNDSLVVFNTDPNGPRFVKEDAQLNADLFANEFSVYPNPTDGAVTISVGSNNTTTAKLQILDPLGKVVYQNTYDISEGINKLDLDLSNYSSGIYIVNIEMDGNRKTCKLAVD